MSTQTKLRRGTAAQCDLMIPAEGEVVVDLTNDRVRIGDGTLLGGFHTPNHRDIQKAAFTSAVATGTENAIALSYTPPVIAYVFGLSLSFKASNNNNGAATVNVNGLGDVTLKKPSPSGPVDLEEGDIITGNIYDIKHDGTYFQLVNLSSSGRSGGLILIETKAASGTEIIFDEGITSDYSNYLLVLNKVSKTGAAGTTNLGLSANGGAAWAYTNALVSSLSTYKLSGTIALFGLDDSENHVLTDLIYWDGSAIAKFNKTGFYNSSAGAAINSIRVALSAGTFNDGSISLYGYVK